MRCMEKKILEGGGGGGRGGGMSLAERRWGFTPAASLNTARFRSGSPLSSPAAVWSPHLTIPPGLSPAALLGSPVMLPDSAAHPSPTTGTFQLLPLGHEILASDPLSSEDFAFSFIFKTHNDPSPIQYLNSAAKQVEFEDKACNMIPDKECSSDRQKDRELSDIATMKAKSYTVHACHPGLTNNQTCHPDEPVNEEDTKSHQSLEEYRSGEFPTPGFGRLSEDGYNWRKYGQKQVKGSEYPRSYYKCTHPNCQVKKKVERSLDGRITEIVYKGNHNHPKPQPTRRSAFGPSYCMSETSDLAAVPGSSADTEGGSVWRNCQQGFKADGLERTSSTSVVTEISDPLSTAQGKHSNIPSDNPELLSTLASHGDDEDGNTQGSLSFRDDSEDDETESKRMKKDVCLIDTTASRAVREPRVVVQTVSEVDILDDGYRWRKYGQKVVKGNPNPRSYYKCTNPGCSVRKHVERASHDLKSVITTYEGKHNHEVPVARNNNNMSSGCNGQPASNTQNPLALPGPSSITKLEPRRQDFVPCFDKKLEHSSEHFIPNYSGSHICDSRLGLTSNYQVPLPHLQPMSLGSFGLNVSCPEAHQSFPISNTIHDLIIPIPPSFARPSNVGLAGYGVNDYGRSSGLESQTLLGQQPRESEIRAFRQPKQEEDNSIYDTPINSLSNAQPSSYGFPTGRFPSN